ncbi:MAG TPA: phosphotransferase [Acidimicrobiales bacterium]|nr:phosphotransferase [Acidimicrobiales bacterium]
MSPTSAEVALPDGVAGMVPAYLGRQRWYGGSDSPDPASVAVIGSDELAATSGGAHRLLWALVDVDGARYQLLIAERPNGEPAEFLNGHERAVLGGTDRAYYYDGTLDQELALALLGVVTDGAEQAERVRPVTVEQSNTFLVFDDRLIMKVFRRLPDGPNPDVEVTEALAAAGFTHVAAPVATWRRAGYDLAFVQQYLAGGTEGWALALTSLRDLYAEGPDDPAEAGGDFGAEAHRLGVMTAEMHLVMAEAFGVDRTGFRSVGWPKLLSSIEAGVHSVVGAAWPGSAADLMDRLRAVIDPGPAIRVHADYHLGQVMRTDTGWYVLDFEGEPARPLSERLAPSSPFKDVTGMLRSFQYAAHFVLLERDQHELDRVSKLAEAWEIHNREAFLNGYLTTEGIDTLLPEGMDARSAVSRAFELDKALYELTYEQAYRPDWAVIPETAIQRLLSGSAPGFGG